MTTMFRKMLTAAAAAVALAGATFATTSTAHAGYGYYGGGYRYGFVKIYRPHYCFKKVKYTYHGPVWVKVCH
jgi:ABC-type sugar transport system substrate-binding protein